MFLLLDVYAPFLAQIIKYFLAASPAKKHMRPAKKHLQNTTKERSVTS
jgi:hypothetical protein